ncbi:MAG: sigma-70 family RNA polymerase sigma factor [Myxococcota bacterium]
MTASVSPVIVEQLWRSMSDRLRAFVARRASSAQDAEDILQDVFLRITVALAEGGDIDRVDAWIYRIARNALIDRHRRTRPTEALDADAPDAALDADDDGPDGLRRALVACLGPFVDQLAPPYQDAIRWIDLEDATHAEAARRAGISVSGMKSRVQRGRLQLRGLLEACCRFDRDCRGTVIDWTPRCGC